LDPDLYRKQAQHVAYALRQADPAGTELYDANLARLTADLEALGTTVVSKIQAVSGVQRTTTNVVVE
jgi:ABC-type Zn uptake system ZnuABC Zn-binding protein ZnuA